VVTPHTYCLRPWNRLLNKIVAPYWIPKPLWDRVTLILPYHSSTKRISNTLHDLFKTFQNNCFTIREIFPYPSLKAFSRAPNIKCLLVRTNLTQTAITNTVSNPGNFSCNKTRCSTRPQLSHNKSVQGPNGSFFIRDVSLANLLAWFTQFFVKSVKPNDRFLLVFLNISALFEMQILL